MPTIRESPTTSETSNFPSPLQDSLARENGRGFFKPVSHLLIAALADPMVYLSPPCPAFQENEGYSLASFTTFVILLS